MAQHSNRAATAPDPPPFEASSLAQQDLEPVRHLKDRVQAGAPWREALLEALGLWTRPSEEHQGRVYQYLVRGEAFDWLVLAERLCSELDGVIPAEEKEDLLFRGRLEDLSDSSLVQSVLGAGKYRAYLNFWYGVVVEEALQLSVEEGVRKRHLALCYADNEDLVEEAYVHLYGAARSDLIAQFRKEASLSRSRPLSLANLKEFTYWLHKIRLKMWDPARVASDTQKGIRQLRLLEEAVAAAGNRPSKDMS